MTETLTAFDPEVVATDYRALRAAMRLRPARANSTTEAQRRQQANQAMDQLRAHCMWALADLLQREADALIRGGDSVTMGVLRQQIRDELDPRIVTASRAQAARHSLCHTLADELTQNQPYLVPQDRGWLLGWDEHPGWAERAYNRAEEWLPHGITLRLRADALGLRPLRKTRR